MSDCITPVVAALIFNKDGKILAARRRKNLSNGGKWEFPGGKLRPGEVPEDCLRREIFEEFRVKIIPRRLFQVVNYHAESGNILLIDYTCKFDAGDFRLSDHDQIKWMNVQNLLELDFSPADIPLARQLVSGISDEDE